VAYTGEPDCSALIGYTILNLEMTGLHTDAHAETVDREHAAFADRRFAGIWDLR
jgi:hypothetical protein